MKTEITAKELEELCRSLTNKKPIFKITRPDTLGCSYDAFLIRNITVNFEIEEVKGSCIYLKVAKLPKKLVSPLISKFLPNAVEKTDSGLMVDLNKIDKVKAVTDIININSITMDVDKQLITVSMEAVNKNEANKV